MSTQNKLITLGAVAAISLTGCKSQSSANAGAKSVDNLSRSGDDAFVSNDDCIASTPFNADKFKQLRDEGAIVVADDHAETIRATIGFSDNVMDHFRTLHARIEARSDAAELCKTAASLGVGSFDAIAADTEQGFPGCWIQAAVRHGDGGDLPLDAKLDLHAPMADAPDQFTMVIGDKDGEIKHSLPRLMGYFVFDRLNVTSYNPETKKFAYGKLDQGVLDLRLALTAGLLLDVQDKPDAFAKVRYLMPATALADMPRDEAEMKKLWGRWRGTNPKEALKFEIAALAESFDSYFRCPVKREEMKEKFPRTAKAVAAVDSDLSASGDGLSLTCGSGWFPNVCAFPGARWNDGKVGGTYNSYGNYQGYDQSYWGGGLYYPASTNVSQYGGYNSFGGTYASDYSFSTPSYYYYQ